MEKYFTISEFAKLRNININSLRYYEKIGVLKPHYVDKKTGYRYYSPEQIFILDVILLYINFGMPLKELAAYINNDNIIDNKELFEKGRKIAQNKRFSPVFPAGLLMSNSTGNLKMKIFFEIVRENINDKYVIKMPSGDFRCCQVDLTPEINIQQLIDRIYGKDIKEEIIISNMLLEKYQIGTKKSELQMKIV